MSVIEAIPARMSTRDELYDEAAATFGGALERLARAYEADEDLRRDWQGALDTRLGNLRLVLHITKASDGTLAATLDSVDQAANGIRVKSITLDSKLNLDVAAVQGTYEGTLAPDGKSISGAWSQGKPLPLEFKKAAGPLKTEHKVAKPSDIDGTWTGTLDSGMGKLRVVFHIVTPKTGSLRP